MRAGNAYPEISVASLQVRTGPEAEHLPEDDPEAPDVAGEGILLVREALERQPLDRDVGVAVHDVAVVGHGACQPEVADLHVLLVDHEDVAGGQIPEKKSKDKNLRMRSSGFPFLASTTCE